MAQQTWNFVMRQVFSNMLWTKCAVPSCSFTNCFVVTFGFVSVLCTYRMLCVSSVLWMESFVCVYYFVFVTFPWIERTNVCSFIYICGCFFNCMCSWNISSSLKQNTLNTGATRSGSNIQQLSRLHINYVILTIYLINLFDFGNPKRTWQGSWKLYRIFLL